jgi:hypothetical protein
MISHALQYSSIVPILVAPIINSERLLVEQHFELNALWPVLVP